MSRVKNKNCQVRLEGEQSAVLTEGLEHRAGRPCWLKEAGSADLSSLAWTMGS